MNEAKRVLVPTAPFALLPTCPERKVSRRDVLKMSVAMGALGFVSALEAAEKESAGLDFKGPMPTPDQILGPFYPVQKPTDGAADLARLKGRTGQAQGQVIYVTGRVLSLRGDPCPGVKLEIWQANGAGRYTHPHDRNPAALDPNFDGYATVMTDSEGRYRYRTVKPGAYPVVADYWRPPHIHYDITGKVNRLITQMYFPDEPLNKKDPLLQQSWAKDSLIARVLPPTATEEPDSTLVVWDIVLIQGCGAIGNHRPGGKMAKPVTLLVGTRKGAFIFREDALHKKWQLEGPHFLGNIVNHLVADPRDARALLMAAKTGHLGPTVFRSHDRGVTWTEAKQPPVFRKAAEGEEGRSVESVFWLTPAHDAEPGIWYAGTSPPGLFRSADGGVTWNEVAGFNDGLYPQIKHAIVPGPDGAQVHSICVDPTDARHLYIGISIGGVFETMDGGQSWRPLNKGVVADFLPDPNLEYGHDPHTLVLHPVDANRLYQQNHCGIYRLDRPATEWKRIGLNMPKEVGDIGFPIVLHPRDPDCAWVFPMDGTEVWPRTCPEGRPAVFRTRDGGASWQRLDQGVPKQHTWWTVKRQAMCAAGTDPTRIFFGTTSGELWASGDEGASWSRMAEHLPHIYSVTVG